jgi:hypothetical protein
MLFLVSPDLLSRPSRLIPLPFHFSPFPLFSLVAPRPRVAPFCLLPACPERACPELVEGSKGCSL